MVMDAQAKSATLKARCPCCGIDAHAHWFPPQWMDLLEREGPRHGVVLGHNNKGHRTAEGGGLPFRQTFAPDMIDLDCIIASMAQARLDMRILSLTNPMVFWAPEGLGLELARTFNDACGEAIRKHPEEIRGAITLPLQSPQRALEELMRAAEIPGMCCAYAAMHVNGTNIDHRSFWPIYEFCEARGLPLCLHPVAPCGSADRLADYHMRNVVGNPHESAIGVACLIFGGVLDAFPDLKILLPHAGGSFPYLVGRWDNAIRRRHELAHVKQPASAYLRRFHYDTISHDAHLMRYLIDRIGVDRFVLGTDYNMDAGVELPVDFIEEIPGVTNDELQRIARDNVMSLFDLHLPAYAPAAEQVA
jgi:aminocarboxymuconate-semialdehyde decarboxylase